MGDALRKVQDGQKLRIPAAAYNAFVDAANDFKRRSASNSREPETAFRDRDVLLVRNDSGESRQRFDILGIDRPIFAPEDNLDEFMNRPSLVGVAPTLPTHVGKFVVLQEPLAPGAIGRAVVDAVTVCRVWMTDASDDRVEVASGECGYLRSDPDGSAPVLWRESGTGTKWAVVRLGLPCCTESTSGSGSFSDDDGSDDGSDDSESSATGSLSGSDSSGSSIVSGSDGSGPSGDDGSDETSGSGSGPSLSGSGSGDLSASGSGPTIDGSNSSGSGSSGSSGSAFPCGDCFCGFFWNGDEWVEAPTQCGTDACPDTVECPPMMPPFFEPREDDDRCFGAGCPASP